MSYKEKNHKSLVIFLKANENSGCFFFFDSVFNLSVNCSPDNGTMTLKEIDFELIFQSKILFFPVLSIKIPICCKNEWSLIDFVSSSLELGNKIICHKLR